MSNRAHPRRASRPGSPPAEPIVMATADAAGTRVTWCRYGEALFDEQQDVSLDIALAGLDPAVTDWLHIDHAPDPTALKWLHEKLGLDPLALEDVHNGQQRSKLEAYEGHSFIVVSVPVLRGPAVTLEQFSLFLGPHWIISFWHGGSALLAPIRQRLRNGGGRIRKGGTDYLCYCLLDLAVDCCFPVLEDLRERMDILEERLLEQAKSDPISAVHTLRRELAVLRRMVLPGQEMLEDLLDPEKSPLGTHTRKFVRDVLDHQRRIGDSLDHLVDMTRGLLELHLMNANQRLGEVMRLLTIIATIFIPLTFVAGIYGMNFDPEASPWNMPELGMRYGYPVVLALFAAIGIGMAWMFRRRGWF